MRALSRETHEVISCCCCQCRVVEFVWSRRARGRPKTRLSQHDIIVPNMRRAQFQYEWSRGDGRNINATRHERKETYCIASASELAFVNRDLLEIWLGLGRGLRFDRLCARHCRVEILMRWIEKKVETESWRKEERKEKKERGGWIARVRRAIERDFVWGLTVVFDQH